MTFLSWKWWQQHNPVMDQRNDIFDPIYCDGHFPQQTTRCFILIVASRQPLVRVKETHTHGFNWLQLVKTSLSGPAALGRQSVSTRT